MAERPHWITIGSSTCALIASGISLWLSIKTQTITQSTNRAILQVTSITPRIQNDSGLVLACQVSNTGRSLATKIKLDYRSVAIFVAMLSYERGDQLIKGMTQRTITLPDIAPGGSKTIDMFLDIATLRKETISPYAIHTMLTYATEGTSQEFNDHECSMGFIEKGKFQKEALTPCMNLYPSDFERYGFRNKLVAPLPEKPGRP